METGMRVASMTVGPSVSQKQDQPSLPVADQKSGLVFYRTDFKVSDVQSKSWLRYVWHALTKKSGTTAKADGQAPVILHQLPKGDIAKPGLKQTKAEKAASRAQLMEGSNFKIETTIKLSDNRIIHEECKPGSTDTGKQYLELQGLGSHHEATVRVSEQKKEDNVDGVCMNLQKHTMTLTDNQSTKKSTTIIRCGAITVHDKDPVGISSMTNVIHKYRRKKAELDEQKVACRTKYYAHAKALTNLCHQFGGKLPTDFIENYAHYKNDPDSFPQKALTPEFLNFVGILETELKSKDMLDGLVQESKKFQGIMQNIKQLDKKLMMDDYAIHDEAGSAKHRTVDDILKSYDKRLNLCVGQALPLLTASLEELAKDPVALEHAMRTGSFMHVHEGYLSTLDPKERVMVDDMKGTLDYLNTKTTVAFGEVDKPTVAVDQSGQITITMPNPTLADVAIPAGKTFMMQTVFFNTGVNEKETMNFVLKGDEKQFQAEMNMVSLNQLAAYAKRVRPSMSEDDQKKLDSAFDELSKHYSTKVARDLKDVKGRDLRLKIVNLLPVSKGASCKSAKDRTAGGTISAGMSALGLDESSGARNRLFQGVSLKLTELNTGKEGYAFNAFQVPFLPAPFTPPSHTRGNAQS